MTTPVLLRLSQIEPRPVSWLWKGRIPLGKVTILDGDPGLGKSTLTLDLAARVSSGRPMPGTTEAVTGGVIVLSAEDAADDTIVPRLQAADADLRYIVKLESMRLEDGSDRPPILPADLDALRRAVAESDWELATRLVVIDPFYAFLDGQVNSKQDHDVRRALHVLSDFAAETDTAVLLVRHLNKAGGMSALYRGGGSIGVIGAARAGFVVGRDPEDPTRRVLAVTKMNLAPEPASLAFRLEVGANNQPHITWAGESPHSADALVTQPGDDDERTEAQDLRAFLLELLQTARTAKEVQTACRGAGFTVHDRTLRRAARAIGANIERHGFGSGSAWVWSLGDGQRGREGDEGDHPRSQSPSSPSVPFADGFERLPGKGDAGEAAA
jgi:AAA domain